MNGVGIQTVFRATNVLNRTYRGQFAKAREQFTLLITMIITIPTITTIATMAIIWAYRTLTTNVGITELYERFPTLGLHFL